ncbi:Y4yA family PLP-dependent enzyme [Nocardia sp. bgisy118]|uniref:Y4yA family PLP-dependent enzyme n=1 Tax=Nocardia sp. bgisy118 TaxID=3413786 RepID=UPI003F4A596F
MGLEAAVEPEPELVDPEAMVLFDIAAPRKSRAGARASRTGRERPASEPAAAASSARETGTPLDTGAETFEPGTSSFDTEPMAFAANTVAHQTNRIQLDAELPTLDPASLEPGATPSAPAASSHPAAMPSSEDVGALATSDAVEPAAEGSPWVDLPEDSEPAAFEADHAVLQRVALATEGRPWAELPGETEAEAPEAVHVLPQDVEPVPASEPDIDATDGYVTNQNDVDDYSESGWDENDSDEVLLAMLVEEVAELLVEEIADDPAGLTAGITAPAMPAHTDEWERRVLADPQLLADIAFAIGGPFHLMYPARVAQNIRGFRDVFLRAGVDGVVYYGKKANKGACVARACAENGAGIDVSSVGELTAALAAGVRGGELMVTGPAKSDDLLWLAVRHGALIAVDSLDELDRLGTIASAATPARALLRVLPAGSASRFGMTDDELDRAQSVIAASGPRGLEPVQLEGFSFHLPGYDAIARAEQAADLIARCTAARELGHPACTISIGGGFGVDYVPEGAWREFTEGVDRSWFHAGKSFDSYYPYHFPVPGPAMLSEILAHGELTRRLRDNDIRLAVEPGRALLDRAGSTVFRVQGSKSRYADGQPYRLLTVDGTSLSLSEQWFDSEYLPDPVLWPVRESTQPLPEPTPTSVGAASCLESDMLSWRRVPLPRRAEPGDLLVYPNTAGYQMDSNESAFHELPIPPKVVLFGGHGDRLRWTLDAG